MASDSNLMGALTYLFGFITGIILFFVKGTDKFVKFHAVQSILWSLALCVIQFILAITLVGLILVPLVWLVGFVSWLFLMYKAYKGEKYKLPFIGDYAEQYAKQYAK